MHLRKYFLSYLYHFESSDKPNHQSEWNDINQQPILRLLISRFCLQWVWQFDSDRCISNNSQNNSNGYLSANVLDGLNDILNSFMIWLVGALMNQATSQ